MIGPPANTSLWIVVGYTDMRKGIDGLAAMVQTALAADTFCDHIFVFVFRGRRGDVLKVLWFDGRGLLLLAKRLEHGCFVWPQAYLRQRIAHTGAAVDAARRHRLAHAGAHAPSKVGGLYYCMDLPPVRHQWRPTFRDFVAHERPFSAAEPETKN